MDIKTYLNQAYRIDQRINSKLEQIKYLRELAAKATSTLSDTGVSSDSKDVQPMESIIVKILDLEREIDMDINVLVDLKREIISIIKQIKNPEYQILLELKYLCFKTWEQIAIDMDYSIQHIFRLHNQSLRAIKNYKI